MTRSRFYDVALSRGLGCLQNTGALGVKEGQ